MSETARIRTGFLLGFLLLLCVVAAVAYRTATLDSASRVIARAQAIEAELDGVALNSVEAESVLRRYAADPADTEALEAGRAALAAEQEHEKALEKLVDGDPVQQSNITFLRTLTKRHHTALSDGPDTSGYRAAQLTELDRNRTGRDLRATASHMKEVEQRVLDDTGKRQRAIFGYTRYGLSILMLTAMGLLGVAAWRMTDDFQKRTAAERTLAARDEQYRQVVELAGDIIYRTDQQGRFTFCNPVALSMLHYTEQEVMGRSYLKLIRQDRRREVQHYYLRQFARNQKTSYLEFPIIDGHGRERWIGQNVQLLLNGDKVNGFQAIARDITDRRRAELDLERSRSFVERIALTTPGILYVYDLDQKQTVFNNREVSAVLGYRGETQPEQEMQGGSAHIHDEVHPDDRAMLNAHYESMRYAQDGEIRRLEIRVRHADGRWVWLAGRETPFERRNQVVTQVVGILQDITSRKAAQDQLAWHANYDALTGLANRHHFWTRLQTGLRRASIEHSTLSLCLFDVDRFKDINDRYGHAAGDEVLEAVGNIVRGELRPTDIAGRPGGDEFCFALPGTDSDEAARVAERIRERLSTMAFGLDSGSPFSVTATFGVAESVPDVDARNLMEAADRALYRAKSAGRNRVCVDA